MEDPAFVDRGGQGLNSELNLESAAVAVGRLKAPFPYFGGKSRIADMVWQRLGDVDNFIEPFCGSAAVLLARPTAPRIETINDADCFVANFWRATGCDPGAVAGFADHPVNECDLHARHRWLVLSDESRTFRERIRTDPDYFDAKVAGWWCWGACCWIGSGWCQTKESAEWSQKPQIAGVGSGGTCYGLGVHSKGPTAKRPILAAPENKSGRRSHHGIGVNAKAGEPSEKLPRLTAGRKGDLYYAGLGVHAETHLQVAGDRLNEKRPRAHRAAGSSNRPCNLPGVLSGDISAGNRPQLADAYARGRGVHGNDSAGTCAERRAWLVGWFSQLRDRLRTVRVCCGDWRRVCESHSVTTRLGLTGIFFDPPYSAEADRCNTLYGVESKTVAHDVRAYCLERGSDPLIRIVLAGYEGEGHEELEAADWSVMAWKAAGGYGNRSDKGKANAGRERLWFSPHCVDPEAESMPLFAGLGSLDP